MGLVPRPARRSADADGADLWVLDFDLQGSISHRVGVLFFGSATGHTSSMPFSSLRDPVELARAQCALDAAWTCVKIELDPSQHDRERNRLAYIVAAFSTAAISEKDLIDRAIQRFREKSVRG